MHGPTLTSATPPSRGHRRRLRRLAGLVGQEVTSPGVRAEVIGGLLLTGILALGALLLAGMVAAGTYFWEAVSPSADNPERDLAPVTTEASTAGVASSGAALGEPADAVEAPGCAAQGCAVLTVADTVVNGRDDGLYVKACFAEIACDRLALAGVGQRVYAQCRVDDGLAVESDTRWVRVPWAFVPNAVASDGSAVALATGQSDPASDRYGWMAARYLGPDEVIDALPACG